MIIMHRLIVAAALVLATASPSVAADAAGAKDDPILKRIEGSEILYTKTSKVNSTVIRLEKVVWDGSAEKYKDTKKIVVDGPLTTFYYQLPAEISPLEAVRQYQSTLRDKGAKVLFDASNDDLDDGYGRFAEQTYPDVTADDKLSYLHKFNHDDQHYTALKLGGTTGNTYFSIYACMIGDYSGLSGSQTLDGVVQGQVVVRVDIAREGAMKDRTVVVKATEMSDTIEKTGRIALYGIHFDPNKSVIKPESAATLAEISSMLKDAGKGKFLIVSHTDDEGGLEYNEGLSKRRAEAVVKALITEHGVEKGQIIPVGVGMAAPIAPNKSEEGKAKNRRVEIVAM